MSVRKVLWIFLVYHPVKSEKSQKWWDINKAFVHEDMCRITGEMYIALCFRLTGYELVSLGNCVVLSCSIIQSHSRGALFGKLS